MRKLSYILLIIFFAGVILFSFTNFAIAIECPPGHICIENPLEAESFEDLLNAVVNFIFYVTIVIAPLMIMIAGFFFLTAGGNPLRIDTARRIILWTVIGLSIVLFAKGLISVLRYIMQLK